MKQVVLVTGANRGIGLQLCRQFQELDQTVIAVCRTPSQELLGLSVEIIDHIDIAKDESVASLKQKVGDRSIDILINNAGILTSESLGNMDFANIRKQFEVNSLGPLKFVYQLLPNLKAGSKIVLMTSRMGSIADNSSGGFYGYRMSKAALNMAGVSLAHDLKSKNIAVGIFHPGMVATRMTQGAGIPTEEAVQGLICRIDELNMDRSGQFFHANGESLPW